MKKQIMDKSELSASQLGRQRMLSRVGEPMFYADWDRALFIHYEVDVAALQRWVPYPLDLYEGRAFVSLVAFTMQGMRPRVGGVVGDKLFAPIGSHSFLNVRTYVKNGEEKGIYFIREWLPNRLAVCVGPAVFGLPYCYGQLDYDHDHEQGRLQGQVNDGVGRLIYQVKLNGQKYAATKEGGLRDFLLERYTAFTSGFAMRRFFRVWHEPWQQMEVDVDISENTLLRRAPGGEQWALNARLIGGNYTPGAKEVWMGRPHFVGND